MAAKNLKMLLRPLRTGGPLNRINEMYGLNKPELSVSIMKLVQHHKPLSEQTLQALLVDHMISNCNLCNCKVVHGGVVGWSERLYDIAKPSYPAVTRKECDDFVYDLFVRGPLRGRMMENKALTDLTKAFPLYQFYDADQKTDMAYAVDIEIWREHALIAGIQVKPLSFLKQSHAIAINHNKNKKWTHPVHYLYYNPTGQFTMETWQNLVNLLK